MNLARIQRMCYTEGRTPLEKLPRLSQILDGASPYIYTAWALQNSGKDEI